MGQSGAIQTRSEAAQGRMWQEAWPALPAGSEDVQELLVTIENLYNTGATCTLTHYLLPGSGKAAHGSGLVDPSPSDSRPVGAKVNGNDQSGTSLMTFDWTASETGVMKAGDCFTVPGVDVLFRVTADASSDGSGLATLTIEPPIVAGSSPTNSGALSVGYLTLASNPIATTNGSTTITVTHGSALPTAVGHTVVLSGSAAVGGISADRLNTAMAVVSMPDADSFTADLGGDNASSTVSAGGGSSVVFTPRATLTAVVLDYTDAVAGPDEYIGGLQVTFREAP